MEGGMGKIMYLISCCLLIMLGHLGYVSGGTHFLRTSNLSLENWNLATFETKTKVSVFSCAALCVRRNTPKNCNAFLFEKTSETCDLAQIDFLENPAPGHTSLSFMISEAAADSLPMTCRGGTHCCDHGHLCSYGEGDCNKDHECKGLLECGKRNCVTDFQRKGGMWDSEDDCCQRKCDLDRPCMSGQGPCQHDTDCHGICDSLCLNRDIFPSHIYPNLSLAQGYEQNTKCCSPAQPSCTSKNPCDVNEEGCLTDDDCVTGATCNVTADIPYCQDIDECRLATPNCLKSGVCINNIGGFSCHECPTEGVAMQTGEGGEMSLPLPHPMWSGMGEAQWIVEAEHGKRVQLKIIHMEIMHSQEELEISFQPCSYGTFRVDKAYKGERNTPIVLTTPPGVTGLNIRFMGYGGGGKFAAIWVAVPDN